MLKSLFPQKPELKSNPVVARKVQKASENVSCAAAVPAGRHSAASQRALSFMPDSGADSRRHVKLCAFAAVHLQARTGGKGRLVGGKVQHGVGDLEVQRAFAERLAKDYLQQPPMTRWAK